MFERVTLGASKFALARIAKDFRDGAAFASRDAIIQIFKDPIQPLPEGTAYGSFTRSHKADEEDGSRP
jgi:hypothetical protein